MSSTCDSSGRAGRGWRQQAASIVEQLFPATSPACWDDLLDLRRLLLSGCDWEQALDVFMRCRGLLEADHYLPFYRLRILLAGSLKLASTSAEGSPNLMALLRRKHSSLEALRRDADARSGCQAPRLRVVEIA